MAKGIGWYVAAAVCIFLGGVCLNAGQEIAGGCFFMAAVLVLAVRVWNLTFRCSRAETLLSERNEAYAQLKQQMEIQEQESRKIIEQTTEQSHKEILKFCSEISHEMRLPISIIAGYADLLCGDIIGEEEAKRKYLEKIGERIRYLNDVLSRHLSQARAGHKDKQVEKTRVDVLALLQDVARDASAAALGKGVAIQVLSVEKELVILGDSAHLTRSFYNIIENAFQYMGRAGNISITVARKDQKARITFQDDGMGLPAEETGRIFELNFQGSNHMEGKGRGHGLYFVRTSVEAHNGTISAESAPGKGMCITITLPVGV